MLLLSCFLLSVCLFWHTCFQWMIYVRLSIRLYAFIHIYQPIMLIIASSALTWLTFGVQVHYCLFLYHNAVPKHECIKKRFFFDNESASCREETRRG